MSILDVSNFPISSKCTAVQAAELVLVKYNGNLIFNGNVFYEWNGQTWEPVDDNILALLGLHLIDKWTSAKSNDFYKSLSYYCKEEINKNSMAVQLRNMVYDLERHKVYPCEEYKHDNMIGFLPVTYQKNAKCDKWYVFLEEVMHSDLAKIELIREFFGYCFLGDNRYQQALVLLGAGNNGKSVILEVLGLLFDKVSHLDLKEIEDPRDVVDLKDSWVNIATELSYKSVETTSKIKAAIAGEIIRAAPKYKQGFSFRPRAKIVFATNGLPRNNDTSLGYFRRLLIINMTYNVDNPNRNLINELKKELPGIFNWALTGLKTLMSRGHFQYENKYVELYKEESSSLYAWWIEEGFNWMQKEMMPPTFKEFYSEYTSYCSGGGMRPAGRNKLRSEIERLQLPVEIYKGNNNIKEIRLDKSVTVGNTVGNSSNVELF
jgi:P4 family phage/plasmid primase-like protien